MKVGKRWRFARDELARFSGGSREARSAAAPLEAGGVPDVSVASLVRAELVVSPLESTRRDAALEEMVRALSQAGLLREERLFLKLLVEREELMSTGIAQGVAVPHPRRAVPGMFEESRVAIGISGSGVDFGGAGGVPVRVLFMICASDDRAHLKILSMLSRLLRDTPVVERILGASDPEEVVKVTAAQEEALHRDAGLMAG